MRHGGMILACRRGITASVFRACVRGAVCPRVQAGKGKGNEPRGCRLSRLHNGIASTSGTCLTRSSLPSASLHLSLPLVLSPSLFLPSLTLFLFSRRFRLANFQKRIE